MDSNVKNAMLSLYLKRKFPVPSDTEMDEEPERQEFIHTPYLRAEMLKPFNFFTLVLP